MSLFWTKKWTEYEEQVKEAYQMGFADGRLCPQGRVCEVNGKPARFHRWVEEDKAMLKINCFARTDEQDRLVRRFREAAVIPAGTSVETARQTFALVEYEDGTVAKVEPEKVKFTDRRVTE